MGLEVGPEGDFAGKARQTRTRAHYARASATCVTLPPIRRAGQLCRPALPKCLHLQTHSAGIPPFLHYGSQRLTRQYVKEMSLSKQDRKIAGVAAVTCNRQLGYCISFGLLKPEFNSSH